MKSQEETKYVAFAGSKMIAKGDAFEVAKKARRYLAQSPASHLLIFNAHSSIQAEFDLRGDENTVLNRLKSLLGPDSLSEGSGPGRPRLGVVSREVSLLPRHWEWLSTRPGGASATIRKLVEQARKHSDGPDRQRLAQDATYKFMQALAGDFPHYEEALRALYSGKKSLFEAIIRDWPKDVREHAVALAEGAFELAP